ncbi:hypothetical protein BT67DRAFT_445505 [Trichocladium antarcticum]|uniref:Uncharacterized protein n=1 Tax=Trichocladium antarcticum TaxID=1450529 RepID=A0AAN6Z9B2_9PEZI|nr:hypothetical protein BT67DRAFT_445505 [Trichocladium antarcticum]
MMFGLPTASSLPTALLAAVSVFVFSPAPVGAVDLETVLAGQTNLTTFHGLVKVRTLPLAQLGCWKK